MFSIAHASPMHSRPSATRFADHMTKVTETLVKRTSRMKYAQ